MEDNKTGLYYIKLKTDIEGLVEIFEAVPFKAAFLEAFKYARTGDEPDESSFDKDTKFMWRILKPMVDDSFKTHNVNVARAKKAGLASAKARQANLEDTSTIGQGNLDNQLQVASSNSNQLQPTIIAEQRIAENSIKDCSAEPAPQTSVYERIRANTNYTEAEAEEPAPALSTLKEICNKGHIKLSAADLEAIWAELAGQGWTFGGEPIRNMSKVLRWYERNPEEIRKTRKQPKRSFSDQRVYEYDELEKKLYSAGMAPDPVPEGSNE